MRIGQKFNKLTLKEYLFFIDNHKRYTDFNALGLYRSIIENKKLDLTDKLEVRDYAHKIFKKAFDFLQIKDPKTFFQVTTLGQELTKADADLIWTEIFNNQQRILTDKRIKHRNFGDYSKHNCGDETCQYKGLMIRKGSFLSEGHIQFIGDKNKYQARLKSEKRKSARKKESSIIEGKLSEE